MPSLVMWGALDQVTPPSGAEWYGAHLPNDTSITYENVAHIPMEEVPERSVTDFIEWIERVSIPTGKASPET